MFNSTTTHFTSGGLLTDFSVIWVDGRVFIIGTTRYGGSLTCWTLDDDGTTLSDRLISNREDAAGAEARLEVITIGGTDYLLTGGGYSGSLSTIAVSASGTLDYATDLGQYAWPSDMVDMEVLTLPNGMSGIYGALTGTSGIARLRLSTDGSFVSYGYTRDYTTTYSGPATSLAHVNFGTKVYLFSASSEASGISVWSVLANGFISSNYAIGPNEGLWISAPSALEVVNSHGTNYLIAAGAGSNSITVMEIGVDGSLKVTDHILDDLDTRFSGVTSLATTEHNGDIWLVAGGADDGLSLFVLLENGQLEIVTTWEDTTSLGLADISTLEIISHYNKLTIAAGSSSESGLTTIDVTIGKALVLNGTHANDKLVGADGDDILYDGAGEDRLTGGSGADVFVFALDGNVDRITDFDPGVDQIDISAWGYLRSLEQLSIIATGTGFDVSWHDEVLIVDISAGKTFDINDLSIGDLVTISRFDFEEVSTSTPEYFCGFQL